MTLLYVEDNKGLREQATRLFEKFFKKVVTAEDGEQGLKIFREFKPKIVVTDIQMPNMDGLEMARRIHKVSPQTKIMITSAFDDTEYLMDAINIGIFRYLKKPLGIATLSTVLLDGLRQLEAEEDDRLFNFYVQNIFNHQQNLLILYHKRKPVIVNNAFLDFFKVDDLQTFVDNLGSLGKRFLPHKDFLFNHEQTNWFSEASSNVNRLYHVKMNDMDDGMRHFIFKMISLEGKDGYFLVSMDDVTELGLLKLFDEKATKGDKVVQDKNAMLRLLETAKRNNAEIKMENFYKGLTIKNKGLIANVSKDKIELRSTYLQQKGAQFEGQMLLSSELFPADILCQKIKKINFEQQSIEVDDLKFVTSSALQRKSIRLEPDEEHTVSLFYQDHKFGDGVHVVDVSLEAARLSLLYLPAGFKADEPVHVDMVFTVAKKPVIINTKATVYGIKQEQREFYVVVKFDLSDIVKRALIDYLSKRQMALIREFKGLQYGK